MNSDNFQKYTVAKKIFHMDCQISPLFIVQFIVANQHHFLKTFQKRRVTWTFFKNKAVEENIDWNSFSFVSDRVAL